MVCSPAWRHQSIYCRRLLDFLEIEHLNHAGQENGRLKATYDQLSKYGLTRNRVKLAIDEALFLGFLRITQHGGRWGNTNQPALYRLTYYGTLGENGSAKPTNDWRGVTEEAILLWQEKAREKRTTASKKQSEKTVSGYPRRYYGSTPVCTTKPTAPKLVHSKTAENSHS